MAAPAQSAGVAAASIDLTNAASDYPGDNASQEQLAKWLAKQAEAAGLPPELPVMAALVESGVKNLNFGDADSVGFFQMRVGIWNQGAYKGYPEKPELQAKWFIDTALAVKRKAIAGGERRLRQGPGEVGRVDRRHRAPRRAVPRPLPAAAGRGAQAPHVGTSRQSQLPPVTSRSHRRSAAVQISLRRRRRGPRRRLRRRLRHRRRRHRRRRHRRRSAGSALTGLTGCGA